MAGTLLNDKNFAHGSITCTVELGFLLIVYGNQAINSRFVKMCPVLMFPSDLFRSDVVAYNGKTPSDFSAA